MMAQPHIYSHQQQYPPADWSHTLASHQQHGHGQNTAAAQQQQHQQHYNRLAAGSAANGESAGYAVGNADGSPASAGSIGSTADERRVLDWIAQLMNPAQREAALLELSKKREQFPQLALILWHSFGTRIVQRST